MDNTKAWTVRLDYEWITLMHAATRGKAIASTIKNVDDYNDFTDFRARRFPELDNKPFTYQNCKDAGFEYDTECKLIKEYEFVNDCRCKVCRP